MLGLPEFEQSLEANIYTIKGLFYQDRKEIMLFKAGFISFFSRLKRLKNIVNI